MGATGVPGGGLCFNMVSWWPLAGQKPATEGVPRLARHLQKSQRAHTGSRVSWLQEEKTFCKGMCALMYLHLTGACRIHACLVTNEGLTHGHTWHRAHRMLMAAGPNMRSCLQRPIRKSVCALMYLHLTGAFRIHACLVTDEGLTQFGSG